MSFKRIFRWICDECFNGAETESGFADGWSWYLENKIVKHRCKQCNEGIKPSKSIQGTLKHLKSVGEGKADPVHIGRKLEPPKTKQKRTPTLIPGNRWGYCAMCSHYLPLTKHHVTPRSHGGKEVKDICVGCHEFIHANFSNSELADLEWENLKYSQNVQNYLKTFL